MSHSTGAEFLGRVSHNNLVADLIQVEQAQDLAEAWCERLH